MAEPLDTHLLRVLYLVLQEKSVSRAADRLGITQPAVSSALKRLREITGDDLLVRTHQARHPRVAAVLSRGALRADHDRSDLRDRATIRRALCQIFAD